MSRTRGEGVEGGQQLIATGLEGRGKAQGARVLLLQTATVQLGGRPGPAEAYTIH